jgi:phosphatidylinositol alpha-1,6-mannosyltransferase
MSPDDKVSARFVLDLALHLTAHAKVFVLAPAGPRTAAREPWGDVTVLRYRYFAPARLQMLAAGEGMVATMRSSALARAQAPLLVAAQWRALPSIVRREGIDLINAHWIVPQGVTSASWRGRLRVPVVVTAHGADVAWLDRSRLGHRIARYVFDRADGFIADSQYLATRTEEIAGRSIPHAAIPMGVATWLFQPGNAPAAPPSEQTGRSARTLLFVGKLVPKKGVNVLVDALHLLRADRRDVRLLLIGGGPLEAEIRDQVARLGLGAAVEMKGWVNNHDLPAYYRTADVVCVPSVQDEHGETEGTPVVLQEAMASGALVVASRSSGIIDVVRDGENGWSVPPNDAPALARAIAAVLALDETSRCRVRAAARDTAGGHNWERVAARFAETFAESAARAKFA